MPQHIDPKELKRVNLLLEREFGVHEDGRPRFRVVWSDDLLEKRWTTHSKDGFELLQPEVIERKKYQHIKERYVLEQLSIVPEGVPTDLIEKLSYEPLWTFEDRHGVFLPPRFDACKLLIEEVYLNVMSRGKQIRKYKEDDPEELRVKELNEVEEYLFGDETPVSDALGLGMGIVVPENKLLDKSIKESNNVIDGTSSRGISTSNTEG